MRLRLDTLLVPLGVVVALECGDPASVAAQEPAGSLQAASAAKFTGTRQVVCGKVAGARPMVGGDHSTYFDLDRPYPDQPVSLVLPQRERKKFSEQIDEHLNGRRVCVDGGVEKVEGQLAIRVTAVKQFKFVGPSSGPPVPLSPRTYCEKAPGVEVPRIRSEQTPDYPLAAMRALLRGTVVVSAVVSATGTISDAWVSRSLDTTFGLDAAALEAARRWRFTPATLDGKPLACAVTIELTFALK